MTKYHYSSGLSRVQNILHQEMSTEDRKRIPTESKMTYSNGYSMWIGSIFVDLRESTELFKNSDRDMVTRIARSFSSEFIEVLDTENAYEVGIRGDCIYAIYSTPYRKDIETMMQTAVEANTLVRMLNRCYHSMGFPNIKVGIGVSASEDLVIKVGRKGHGINDMVWVGTAVSEASNLSKLGSKFNHGWYYRPIVISNNVYVNLSEDYLSEFPSNSFTKCNEGYHLDVVDSRFDSWIAKQSI